MKKTLFDISQINLMGFIEILPHIFRLKKLINLALDDIIAKDIDVLVTIDSPGFTFRVVKMLKKRAPHIKLVHIVAPSVWAYKPCRAKKYAEIYDKLLTLFPFEPPYFTAHGLDAVCIGHPVLEEESLAMTDKARNDGDDDDRFTIVVTPGSRKGEIAKHMKIIREALEILSKKYKIKAIFVQSNDQHIQYIRQF